MPDQPAEELSPGMDEALAHLLAAQPPLPIPPEVAARIRAALLAEATVRTEAANDAPHLPRPTLDKEPQGVLAEDLEDLD